MTDALRLTPHFIVIGAMKCGTTTLYRYLDTHPDIDMSRDKETDYFVAGRGWQNGPEWYANQFSGRGKLRGEASPNYTKRRSFPGVPERMAAACPDLKLIYIVRDPVVRAESHFRHNALMGTQPGSVAAFARGPEYDHVLDSSSYAAQLEAYHKNFARDAILVVDFDDLKRDPQVVLNQIFDHIGAAPFEVALSGAHNDSSELKRVPAPILRFAQSPLGRRITGLIGRETRDKIRGALARGKTREPEAFPEDLKDRIRDDLADDMARLRAMTGQRFAGWSV